MDIESDNVLMGDNYHKEHFKERFFDKEMSTWQIVSKMGWSAQNHEVFILFILYVIALDKYNQWCPRKTLSSANEHFFKDVFCLIHVSFSRNWHISLSPRE